jgi:hypothetical protein
MVERRFFNSLLGAVAAFEFDATSTWTPFVSANLAATASRLEPERRGPMILARSAGACEGMIPVPIGALFADYHSRSLSARTNGTPRAGPGAAWA